MRSVLAGLVIVLALSPLAGASASDVFIDDANTLARLELNGNGVDASGNGRDATILAPLFVATPAGQGAKISTSSQGIDWSPYASLLTPPFTVEMVFSPGQTSCSRKVLGGDDTQDAGWYLCGRVTSFPAGGIGPPLIVNARHYVALRSVTATSVRVFVDGVDAGTISSYSFPAPQAIFFRDDTVSSRAEQFNGTVDAMRFSNSARTAQEIAAVQCTVASTCSHFLLSSASAGVAGRSLMRQGGNWDNLDVGFTTARTWRASEAALSDTTFGTTPFIAHINYKALGAGGVLNFALGTINTQGVFSPIPGALGEIIGADSGEGTADVELGADFEFVVPAGHYLALRATSSTTGAKIHTGGQLQSYLVNGLPPASIPLPELETLVLVGLGVISISLFARRRRS